MRLWSGSGPLMRSVCAGALALGAATTAANAVAAAPAIVPVQGHVADANGVAVQGSHDLTFALFDGATSSNVLYTEQRTAVPLDHGDFVVYLGDQATGDAGAPGPDLATFRDHDEVWLELTIDGTEVIAPRFRIATVPYAGYAPYCGPNNSIDNGALQALVGGNVGIKQSADANAALAVGGDVLLAPGPKDQGRRIGLPILDDGQIAVGQRDLTIQAGSVASATGYKSPGGNLILMAGNANTAQGEVTYDNNVRIYAGDNVWTGSGSDKSHGNVELYAGSGQPLRWVLVGDTGNVGIGVGAPTHKLEVNGQVAGNGAYVSLSDGRFKTNVATIEDALAIVEKMRGVRYDWRAADFPERSFESGRQTGFIAQELATVLPEAVSQDSNGIYSVAYAKVVPVLVEAMKEQQQRLEAKDEETRRLAAELAATEKRQAQTEARLERLEAALRRK